MKAIEVMKANYLSATCHQADAEVSISLSSGSTFRGDYQHHISMTFDTENNSVIFRDDNGKIVDARILLSLFAEV
jgi:hypothetical protein